MGEDSASRVPWGEGLGKGDFGRLRGGQFRPLLYASLPNPTRQYCVIEDKMRGFRFPTLTEQQLRDLSQRSGRNMETPQAARELDDVQLRLQHMDALGIDIQVLHNTLWIERSEERRVGKECRS